MKATELIQKLAGFIAHADGDVDVQLVIEEHDGFESKNQRVGAASFALYGGYDGEPVRIVSRENIEVPVPPEARREKPCGFCTNGYDPFEDDNVCPACAGTGTGAA